MAMAIDLHNQKGFCQKHSMFWVVIGLCLLALLAMASRPAFSQEAEATPLTLQADILENDQDSGIIQARGNVIIANEKHHLRADIISYDQNKEMISATGNVVLIETGGSVIRTDQLIIDKELANGIAQSLLIELDKQTRIAAASGRRIGGEVNELNKAVYSPCEPCLDEDGNPDPDKELFWQVRGEDVVHDEKNKNLYFYDATLEILGVPVFYVPYFSAPDPTVKRRSGLLVPSFGSTTHTGSYYAQPGYVAIGDYADMTLTPYFTENAGVVLEGEYRHAIEDGDVYFLGSFAADDPKKTAYDNRYHYLLKANKKFTNIWQGDVQISSVSDDRYLDEYSFFTAEDKVRAVSNFNLYGINQNQIIHARASHYKDLRDDADFEQPTLLPMVTYKGQTSADNFGGRFKLKAALRNLDQGETVEEGQMVSLDATYGVQNLMPYGLVGQWDIGLRADYFNTNFTKAAQDAHDYEDGSAHRIIPHASGQIRMPLARKTQNYGRQVVEPTIGIFLAPKDVGNDKNIGNEDSLIFEAEDSTLFTINRPSGYDRVENGVRAAYGVQFSQFFAGGEKLTGFVGQTYRFHDDKVLEDELNIAKGFSDYVGRFDIEFNPYIDLGYRFAIDDEDGQINRQEASFKIGQPAFHVTGGYSYLSKDYGAEEEDYERIFGTVSSRITNEWRTSFASKYDLVDDRTINAEAALIYSDECFDFILSAVREYNDDDVDSNKIGFTIKFKTLGEVDISEKIN